MTVRARVLIGGLCLAAALPILPALAQGIPPAVAAAVADKGRPAADVMRDAERKPAEVVAFAGIKPGMTVEELNPGGGYFTRIFSKVVGPKGKLYLLSADERRDRSEKGQDALAAEVGNAVVVWQHQDHPVAPEKVDLVWTSDNYHDFRNGLKGDMSNFNKAVFDALKPGGAFVVEDYEAAAGAGVTQTQTLHRIEDTVVEQEVEAAGFKFERASDVLRNPKDDHTQHSSSEAGSDQFVLMFRKPK